MLFQNIKLQLIATLAVLLPSVFSLTVISAQNSFEEQGLAIRPAILDIAIEDGSNQHVITIANISEEPIAVKARVEPLAVDEEFKDVSQRVRYDISKWIVLEQDTWLLERGEEVDVKFHIEAPEDATPGGHYGQIAFRVAGSSSITDTSSAVIIPEVTGLIFINVPGEIVEGLEIEQSISSGVSLSGTLSTDVTYINTGNTHVIVQPYLRVESQRNDSIISEQLSPVVVMPGTSRTVSLSHKVDGLFGSYKVWSEAIYGTPSTSTSTAKAEILVISPLFLLAGTLVILLIIGLIVARTSKRSSFSASKKRYSRGRKFRHPEIRVKLDD